MDKIKQLIHKRLKEESSTGSGGASFTPGEGEQYTTKYAFKLKKLKENESDTYLNQLNISDAALTKFIGERVKEFDEVENKLNILLPLLKKAKQETMEFYKTSPSFEVKYGTDLAVDYLNDLITLFQDKK